MTDLNGLYKIASENKIDVDCFELNKRESLAVMDDNGKCSIAIDPFKLSSTQDEKVKLAHELGHCETKSFYNRWATCEVREKHEYRADKWATHCLIPLDEYEIAINNGYTEVWQLAEYFDVTEDFIRRTDYLYRCEGWQGNDITDKENTEITPEKNSFKPAEPQIPQPVSEAPKLAMQKPTQKAEITTLSQLVRFMVQCEKKRRNAQPQARKRVSIDIWGER